MTPTAAHILSALLLIAAAPDPALCAADAPDTPFADGDVRASLVADVATVVPGRPFTLGVRLDIEDTWHVNWINPGDAGLAPSVAWRLPDGFVAGALEWPYPGRYRFGPLVIFGYDKEVILTSRVTPPDDLEPGSEVVLAAEVDWLACQEACVPGEAAVSLRLAVSSAPETAPEGASDVADAARRVPVVAPEWNLRARYDDDAITIDVQPVALQATHVPRGVFFCPTEQGVIENAESQTQIDAGRGFELRVPRSRSVGMLPGRLTGVLVSANGWNGDGMPSGIQVDVALEPR